MLRSVPNKAVRSKVQLVIKLASLDTATPFKNTFINMR
jgi:hypothetical protein